MAGLIAVEFCTVLHKYDAVSSQSNILCDMVQNYTDKPKSRGRPRAYDPEVALQRARDKFWKSGYAQTSLDEICAAVGMNRPSLYAAFGDKRALYLTALEHYWQLSLAVMHEALADKSLPLDEALMRAFDGQLSLYFAFDGLPRGCFAIGTAITEAVEDSEIRSSLANGFRALDAGLEARIRAARDSGALNNDADPAGLALLASATLHSIAIRARVGVSRSELREMASKAVKVICG
jgi:AcrR family transcriptional regulator